VSKLLVVTTMNGAFGFEFGKVRDYMSDVVQNILNSFEDFNDYELAFHYEKGGMFERPDRRIRDFVLDLDASNNVLLMIGKSYGGKDTAKIINKIGDKISYKAKYVVLVDPCWATAMPWSKIKVNRADKVWNFIQHNNVFLNGAKAKVPDGTELFEKDLSHYEGIKHFSIIHNIEVREGIKNSIRELIV
jgi:hypothetical protein